MYYYWHANQVLFTLKRVRHTDRWIGKELHYVVESCQNRQIEVKCFAL